MIMLHWAMLQASFPMSQMSTILIKPKGKKRKMKHLVPRLLDLDSPRIKSFFGILEYSKQGVPHLHGFAICDRRFKIIPYPDLVIIRQKPKNAEYYMQYMCKHSPSLLVVNHRIYRLMDGKLVEHTLITLDIVQLLNNFETQWT